MKCSINYKMFPFREVINYVCLKLKCEVIKISRKGEIKWILSNCIGWKAKYLRENVIQSLKMYLSLNRFSFKHLKLSLPSPGRNKISFRLAKAPAWSCLGCRSKHPADTSSRNNIFFSITSQFPWIILYAEHSALAAIRWPKLEIFMLTLQNRFPISE